MEKFDREDEIVLYGARWCPDTQHSVKVLKRQGATYRWVDIDEDLEGCEFVKRINMGMKSIPTIVFPDGDLLVEPTSRELIAKVNETV
jgi:mycoredoxin